MNGWQLAPYASPLSPTSSPIHLALALLGIPLWALALSLFMLSWVIVALLNYKN